MHMADALVSPAVGGVMWATSAGLIGYCCREVKRTPDERRVPLMGVLGAFVFAAQMINFTIPGTGSSGHLGGGLLLAILLGPCPAFLTLASVLTVQALFFADGGLLALGANIFNLGLLPCFLAYPFVYRPLAGRQPGRARMLGAATLAAVVGLELGAFAVVLETLLSGITELPFREFVLLMLPIHLAIGLVEGLATAGVVGFVARARPEVIDPDGHGHGAAPVSLRPVLVGLLLAAVCIGGAVSWFASSHPDGLEWSMFRAAGKEELEQPADGVHGALAGVQESTALLPDYGFPEETPGPEAPADSRWPAVDVGTSVSGLLGGAMTLLLAGLIGWLLKRRRPAGRT